MTKALMMVATYTESLLNDGSALTVTPIAIPSPYLDGESYTEVLLKDGSDIHSDSLYQVLTLTARSTGRFS